MPEHPRRTPRISVVVPTFNRADRLLKLISALSSQHGVDSYEVVVVDDSSTDGTWELLEGAATAGFALRRLRTAQNSGPAAARNLGWRGAHGSLIAFTDDDCAPQPEWLAALERGLRDADVVQGLTEVDSDEAAARGPFARILVITEFSWKFETCNIGYRRDVLEALGGFEESFRKIGEDVDLGWRALEAGAVVKWAAEAVVLHAAHKSGNRIRDWAEYLRYARRLEGAAEMVKRHPGLRAHLHRRYFYKPYHAPTLLALAALPLARLSPTLSLAGWAPWLRHRVWVDPLPARRRWLWAVLPMVFAADATELLATARGALRARTILL